MISSASRALEILKIIGRSQAPMGVVDVARALGIVPGTAFRSLNALEGMGYLSRYQSSTRYVLGPVAVRLHHRLLSQFRLREVSLPYLDQLAFATGETVSVSVPIGWYSLRIAEAEGARDVTGHSPVGELNRLGDTLPGRAILARLPPAEVDAYLAWSADEETSGAAEALNSDLVRTREQGFAAGETSYAPGQRSVAIPLIGNDGVVAAIAIEGPVLGSDRAQDKASVAEWIAMCAPLEQALRIAPDQADNPFSHLTPGDVAFHAGDAPDR